jgi:hypothetical protein
VLTVTHCDQLLQVLSDGRPHDHRQLYALGMVVHSRISDLRRRGIAIRHWRENGTSFYQLGSELTERGTLSHGFPAEPRSVSSSDQLAGTGLGRGEPAATGPRDTALPPFDGVPVPAEIVGQLSLEAA